MSSSCQACPSFVALQIVVITLFMDKNESERGRLNTLSTTRV